jgi:uncharacterized protein (UPF0248 family)
METIQQLLSRIRWDDEFGRGTFHVGIYDRFSDSVEFVPLENLQQEHGNHFKFGLVVDGEEMWIPYHRIREVRKNGKTIWKR